MIWKLLLILAGLGVFLVILLIEASIGLAVASVVVSISGNDTFGTASFLGGWILAHWLIVVLLKRWQTRKMRLDELRHRAYLDTYSRWTCPQCSQPFGTTVFFIKYPLDHELVLQGRVFIRHVIITCPHCRFLNCFDPQGNPMTERGELFEPQRQEGS